MPRKKTAPARRETVATGCTLLLRVRSSTNGAVERITITNAEDLTLADFEAQLHAKYGAMGKAYVVPVKVPGDRVGAVTAPVNRLGALDEPGTLLKEVGGVEQGTLVHYELQERAGSTDVKKESVAKRKAGSKAESGTNTKRKAQTSSISFPDYSVIYAKEVASSYRVITTDFSLDGVGQMDLQCTAARSEAVKHFDDVISGRRRAPVRPWISVISCEEPGMKGDNSGKDPKAAGRLVVEFRGENPKPRQDDVPLLNQAMMVDLVRAILVGAPVRRARALFEAGENKKADDPDEVLRSFKMSLLNIEGMAKRWPPLLWSMYHHAEKSGKSVRTSASELAFAAVGRLHV